MLISRLSSSATTVAARNGQNLVYITFIYSTYPLPALIFVSGLDLRHVVQRFPALDLAEGELDFL